MKTVRPFTSDYHMFLNLLKLLVISLMSSIIKLNLAMLLSKSSTKFFNHVTSFGLKIKLINHLLLISFILTNVIRVIACMSEQQIVTLLLELKNI